MSHPSTDWNEPFARLNERYCNRQHPLQYRNLYQLMIMTILSARSSDKHINRIAPPFFEAYPRLSDLARAQPQDLHPFLRTVPGYRKKCEWICRIAEQIGSEEKIPLTLEGLIRLKGIGRKTALVILRELGRPGKGIIVDLHVVRIVKRLGLGEGTPAKIEKALMETLDPSLWADAGMSLSFLGREVCRPRNPNCPDCVFKETCVYTVRAAEKRQ
jgi:endonuclease-3